MYLYEELLDPDLYDKRFVARFIESLSEPEVNTQSDENITSLHREMMPTDDIEQLIDPLVDEFTACFNNTGTVAPRFVMFLDKSHRVNLEVDYDVPTKTKDIRSFLAAGKCLSMIRQAQCVFFCTMHSIKKNKPIIGMDAKKCDESGLFIIGSSLRGNCFTYLSRLSGSSFDTIDRAIMREGQYDYPFSEFFNIQDEREMVRIVEQMPKLMCRSGLSENECVINFATTLKALKKFGYKN